jgi:hypothetical protein
MPELSEHDLAEIKAFEYGASCAKTAIPQLIAVTESIRGHEAKFWDALINGLLGAACAHIGFDQVRQMLIDFAEAIDKTEANIHASKANTTHH